MGWWRLARTHGRRIAVLAAVAVLIAAGGAVWRLTPWRHGAEAIHARAVRIHVVDGPRHDQHVTLDATYFRPADGRRHPAVLLAHGLGDTKTEEAGKARALASAGYAVLTWSARGFGNSTGQIGLDAPDYEVTDVHQLVDWLARRPNVLLDRRGDPRVGIAGASYGGAIALLAAGYDHRIDAIAPEYTWHDLSSALLPNAAGGRAAHGVYKRLWAGLLYTRATAGAAVGANALPGDLGLTLGPRLAQCGRFLPNVCRMYQRIAAAERGDAAAVSMLRASSPVSVQRRIHVPTMLVQGQNDSLFPLDQADANAAAISRNGAPVKMVWTQGGHDGGYQQTGQVTALTRQWFDHWLKPAHPPPPTRAGARGTGPAFTVIRSGGTDSTTGQQVWKTATATRYPGLAGTAHRTIRLTGSPQTVTNPAGGSPPSISQYPGLGALPGGGSLSTELGQGMQFNMPGQTAVFGSSRIRSTTWISGRPRVRLHVSGSNDMVLFVKLYDVTGPKQAELVHGLAAPVRVTGAGRGRTVTVALPAIDHQVPPGDKLRLVVTTTDLAYASPSAPATYQVSLADGGALRLPLNPRLRTGGGAPPAWVWILPAVAVAVAIGIVTPRRRPGHRDEPEPPDVPLRVTGLTKRYPGGQLAVDDVSLRAERGQVLGLLGPNGAGKTTLMRMLLGLIRPDAGEIRIFGHRVAPGAAVLSRLGALVEGPGFMPHLSGRQNLDLYWRATGRPTEAARMDEALAIAGLGNAIDRRVRTYSQGMRQRLALAEAMLGLPDVLVLDEPTNGLDPPQIAEVRDVLTDYAGTGRTVIVSSHLLAEVEQTCSHLVVMRDGAAVAAGRVGEIVGNAATLTIGTDRPRAAADAARSLPGVAGVSPNGAGVVVRLDGARPAQIVEGLVQAGVPVESVVRGRRLEDVFFDLMADAGEEA